VTNSDFFLAHSVGAELINIEIEEENLFFIKFFFMKNNEELGKIKKYYG